jgi:TPR repeat protein
MRNLVFLFFVLAASWTQAQPMPASYGLDVGDSELSFMFGNHSRGADLELGRHGPADYAGAASAYRKAAVLGFPLAQNNLARLYETGRGVQQDFILAHMWYALAAASGDESLEANRDASANRLSAEDIAKAEALARALKRHLPNPMR